MFLCILFQPLSEHWQVWKYTAAMAHFRNCMEVAACAAAEKRRYTLAITYDELCRKHWSQKAARGDRDFDINTVSFVKDKDLLERARALFDASAKGSHLCMPLSCTLLPVCICKAKQQSPQPRRRAQSQLQPNSWETLAVRCRRLICRAVVTCILLICPSAGKKFGKGSWAKGHGKSKSYHGGSSWGKKSYGSSW